MVCVHCWRMINVCLVSGLGYESTAAFSTINHPVQDRAYQAGVWDSLHVHLLCENTSDLRQGHFWLIGWLAEDNVIWKCPSAAVKGWRVEYSPHEGHITQNLWGSCNRLVCKCSVYLCMSVCLSSGNMPHLCSGDLRYQVIFHCKVFCVVPSPWVEVECSRNTQRVVSVWVFFSMLGWFLTFCTGSQAHFCSGEKISNHGTDDLSIYKWTTSIECWQSTNSLKEKPFWFWQWKVQQGICIFGSYIVFKISTTILAIG